MLLEIARIFINVVTPVFTLVLIGYLVGPRLGLEARTLSRFAYFILIPCFIFNVLSQARVEADLAIQMMIYILIVHIGCALLAFFVGWTLRRSKEMVSAYILIGVFGNVGNFGLPLIEFHLGPDAIVAATVYFLAIIIIAFVIGVGAANWHTGGSWGALLAVFKTPALIALIPALAFNGLDTVYGIAPPLFLTRITGLLGAAMIPTMLVALGVQLAGTGKLTITKDTVIASSLRLIGGPALALLIIIFFSFPPIERGAGIFQSSMPTAVLASIIALEYDLLPDFVTTTVSLHDTGQCRDLNDFAGNSLS